MADTENAPELTPGSEPSATEPKQLTAIEQKAAEQGWVPQEEWEGDPEQWRPAKEFLDRGELFKKIEDQNRTIKEFKKALEDLKGHHAKTREVEYKRALETLKAQKVQAIEDGDAQSVVKLDDQIDLVKEEQRKLAAQAQEPSVPELNPEFVAWVDRNKWYERDENMKIFADALGQKLSAAGRNPSAVLAEVERQVREEFPHKFKNPNRDKPGAVESSATKGGKGSDSFTLTDEERRVMQRFVRTGVMTEKEYITELKRTKGA
jgi:predicted metal-dependent hydrolase